MSFRFIKMCLVSSCFFLASCGGGSSSSDSDPDPAEALVLTVGNINIDSNSSINARLTRSISVTDLVQGTGIDIIITNKIGDRSISGGADAALFEITQINNVQYLAFISTPDEFNPADANADGRYEVDVRATDNDNQSVTLPLSYAIDIPIAAQDVLSGKTFYIDGAANNEYQRIVFNDTGAITTDFTQDGAVAGSESALTDFEYRGTSISYTENGANLICSVIETPDLKLLCGPTEDNQTIETLLLSEVPEIDLPDAFTLTSTSITDKGFPAPEINSFSLTGNQAIENGQAVISRSSFQGKFKYRGSAAFTTQKIFIGVGDGSGVIRYNVTPSNTSAIDSCEYLGFNTGVEYVCTDGGTVEIINTSGSLDTNLLFIACFDVESLNDANPNNCNSASIPVRFVD